MREQFATQAGRQPEVLVACVGGGSNAIGLFHAFLGEAAVRKVGVEAGGDGLASGRHAARIPEHSVGVLHGTRTLVLQDEDGARALAWVLRDGKTLGSEARVIVNLSGRGDKDVEEVLRVRGRG